MLQEKRGIELCRFNKILILHLPKEKYNSALKLVRIGEINPHIVVDINIVWSSIF